MRYDEHCFERWSEKMEAGYLSQRPIAEKHLCCSYDCANEANIQIDGAWYCAECAMLLEEILSDHYIHINSQPDPVVR